MENSLTFLWMLVQTILALAFVCGLAYVVFRVVLPRLASSYSGNSMIRVVDRTGLEARKTLFIIEVAGKWMLVASSEAGVQLISELDPASAEELERSFKVRRESGKPMLGKPFGEILGDMIKRKRGGEE